MRNAEDLRTNFLRNEVWGRQFISKLSVASAGIYDNYIIEKVKSGQIVPVDGVGWECMLPCCATPGNMRTSYKFSDRAAHELRHNSPGMWLEAPK